jgi:hypothetical protein
MPLAACLMIFKILKNLQAVASGLMAVGKHLGKDLFGEGTQVSRKGNTTPSDHFKVGLHLKPLVTCPSHQHLVKDDSQRPHVALFGVEIIHIGLRSHVLGRSDVIEHLRLVWNFRHLAVAEIDDYYTPADFWPRLKKQIVRLEVAVHYALASDLPVAL